MEAVGGTFLLMGFLGAFAGVGLIFAGVARSRARLRMPGLLTFLGGFGAVVLGGAMLPDEGAMLADEGAMLPDETATAPLAAAGVEVAAVGAEPECAPVELARGTRSFLELYAMLGEFKDEPAFAQYGFSEGQPYHDWLQLTRDLDDVAGDEVWQDLMVTPGELGSLGLSYVSVKAINPPGSESDWTYIRFLEKRIAEGLDRALCRPGKTSN